ncbi:hypothetical protein [Streptomyces sp. AP-93]|uniref:hypothetical protein n=1 Tax=Streptomyces sp. AP-93 TaxID=2929048 RepID=UPI001FAF9A8B|nr:hypothetical protein [Streptomyces sp. AP-93]MCJ0874459.1 hypothetical protein [Streptomyces sp. AP-93]
MKNPEPDQLAQRQEWAKLLIAELASSPDIDEALTTAVHGRRNLAAETNLRRANALHAAAMGLGPAGCATAAGVSESILASWRKDPSFDNAMASASALAVAHEVAPRGRINGLGLHLVLRSILQGAFLGTAAASIGLRSDQILRIRRENPLIDSLIETAVAQGRVRRPKRRLKHPFSYRLVDRTEASSAGAPPATADRQDRPEGRGHQR